MLGYLKRLATTGAAYQAADVVSRVFALVTLPLYLHHVSAADYGVSEIIVTAVVLASIPLRLGLGEAVVRFWFLDEDEARRRRVARATVAATFWVSTFAGLALLPFAGAISELLLDHRDAVVVAFGLLGLWAFANLEVAKALLRVEERWRAFLVATVGNVTLTVVLTVTLVVIRDEGARGLVAGNFVASAVTVLGLWAFLRGYVGLLPRTRALRPLLGFGLPTVPADTAAFALNVVDRVYLGRADSLRAAGLYALSVKVSSVVIVAVRGFQYAWPPLAYSVTDDDEARRLYGVVTTWYLAVTGYVVVGLTLLGRWALRLFFEPRYLDAYQALPWVGLGWALSGLFLVYVVVVGRLRITSRNVPASVAGLAVNVVLLVALVGPLGIAGAGIALSASYVVMLVVLYLFTRSRFRIAFEWGRLVRLLLVFGGGAVAGELLLPTSGVAGLASRAALAAALPIVLILSGFFTRKERARALSVVSTRLRRSGESRRSRKTHRTGEV
jgi:O-antigen/teichoic acid export membrane protein